MKTDTIDDLQNDWARQRPDLDADPMGVVLRIVSLARRFQDQAAERLAAHGMEWWRYDALSALLRQGPPWRLTASELAEAGMLTSGAMTHRIDRLASEGLVRRVRDEADGRRVLVELTERGRQRVDAASEARFAAAAEALAGLAPRDVARLSNLLRALMLAQ